MAASDATRQPIGFWLKRADSLLTDYANHALREQGLTRFHWQLLNLCAAEGPLSSVKAQSRLQDFVDAAGFQRLVAELVRRGWLSDGAARGRLGLTDAGRDAHGRVAARMAAVREASTRGMSEEDYARLVGGLKQLCENLETALEGEQHGPAA